MKDIKNDKKEYDIQAYLDKALKNINISQFVVKEEPYIEDYDIEEEIRLLVIRERTSLELTQSQLSKKSGVSQANISKIEKGSYKPSFATLKKLADAMGKRIIVDFVDREEIY